MAFVDDSKTVDATVVIIDTDFYSYNMSDLPDRLLIDPSPYDGPPPVSSRLQELPYWELSWENFENLVCRIARRRSNVESCRPYGKRGDKQAGIDLYARRSGADRNIVYQCKKEKNFSAAKIRETVATFLGGDWITKSEEFVLCTQESLRNRERTYEIEIQRQELLNQGIKFTVWDSVELDLMLKEDAKTVFDFFGASWCELFCDADVVAKLKQKRPDPNKNYYPRVDDYFERLVVPLMRVGSEPHTSNYGKSLIEVVDNKRRVALLGPANSGKTTELRNLAFLLTTQSGCHPYLVQLKYYTGGSLVDHVDDIAHFPSDSVVVLFDGLDEVASSEFDNVRKRIEKFALDYPTIRIIVSCRVSFYVAYLKDLETSTLEGFAAYKLLDLSEKQVEDYLINANVEGHRIDKDAFLAEIRSRRFDQLLHIPHYLVRFVSDFSKEGRIEKNIFDLNVGFIQSNLKKDVDRYFQGDKAGKECLVYQALQKFAFMLQCRQQNSCTWQELQTIADGVEVKLLKAASSLVQGSESNDFSWSFVHNTFQETLAAGFLRNVPFREIRRLMCFKPKFIRLRPGWISTLSMLISIIDEKRRKKIIDWLSIDHKHTVVLFEVGFVDVNVRLHIIHQIFKEYEKLDIRINSIKYSLNELAVFARDRKIVSFLYSQLELTRPGCVRADSLEILSHYDIELDFPVEAQAIKDAVISNIYGPERDVARDAIKTYCRGFQLTDFEFEDLFEKHVQASDTLMLAVLYDGLLQQNRQDQYLRSVLHLIDRLISLDEVNDSGLNCLQRHLSECVKAISSEFSIEILVSFLVGKFERVYYSKFFRGVIDFVLVAAAPFKNNLVIYNNIKSIFINELLAVGDIMDEEFVKYFKCVDRFFDAFKTLYNSNFNSYVIKIQRLAKLATIESVDFLVSEFTEGRVSKGFVMLFQDHLESIDRGLSLRLNERINSVAVIPLRDSRVEKLRQAELTHQLLFSLDKFVEMTESVYNHAGADILYLKDFLRIVLESENTSYPCILYDSLPLNVDPLERNFVIQRIKVNWSVFSLQEIYLYLKKNREVLLSESERLFIKDWCIGQLKLWRFTDAARLIESGQLVAWPPAYVSFFIRRIGFTDLSEDVYLDLLSFDKCGDDEVDIFPFVLSVLNSRKVETRVIGNLKNESLTPTVVENHLLFVCSRKMKSAAPLLVPYINRINTLNRRTLVKRFIDLGGELSELEQILPVLDDEIESDVITMLINHSSRFVKGFLIDRFKKTTDTKRRVMYAYHLSAMGDTRGVKYILEYMRENKEFPFIKGSVHLGFLWISKKVRMLPWIFRAFEIGYDPEMNKKGMLNLRDMAINALNSVCLDDRRIRLARLYFKIYSVEAKIRMWLSGRSDLLEVLNGVKFYFDLTEPKYYGKEVRVMWTDALWYYRRIRKRN